MCFWQWLVANKEVINMIANIAIALALIVSIIVLSLNIGAFRRQKRGSQAEIFHNISNEINLLMAEQNQHEKAGTVKNWLERLMLCFEYFAFFANRDHLSKDMSEYYVLAIESYSDYIITYYKKLAREFKEGEKGEYSELAKYYRKYLKKEYPFNLLSQEEVAEEE